MGKYEVTSMEAVTGVVVRILALASQGKINIDKLQEASKGIDQELLMANPEQYIRGLEKMHGLNKAEANALLDLLSLNLRDKYNYAANKGESSPPTPAS